MHIKTEESIGKMIDRWTLETKVLVDLDLVKSNIGIMVVDEDDVHSILYKENGILDEKMKTYFVIIFERILNDKTGTISISHDLRDLKGKPFRELEIDNASCKINLKGERNKVSEFLGLMQETLSNWKETGKSAKVKIYKK